MCTDGSVYWQICFYCANVVETIISPQAVLASSDVFHTWTQTGYKDGRTGSIRFDHADGFLSMHLPLDYHDGLYYCTTDVLTVDPDKPTVDSPKLLRVALPVTPSTLRRPSRYTPVSKSKQLESELWLLCLGSPGVTQLDRLPGNVTGIPAEFDHHPFQLHRLQSPGPHKETGRSTYGHSDNRKEAPILHGLWFYAGFHLNVRKTQ